MSSWAIAYGASDVGGRAAGGVDDCLSSERGMGAECLSSDRGMCAELRGVRPLEMRELRKNCGGLLWILLGRSSSTDPLNDVLSVSARSCT